MEFTVITGMSGAGKTHASNIFEDLGYYCIDNMPSKMIPYFVELYSKVQDRNERVAFVIDVRGESDFISLLTEIDALKAKGYDNKLVFIDCNDQVLITRYKESRRVHPLVATKNLTVKEALVTERMLLLPVKERADYTIDTTNLTPSQLRDKLVAIQDIATYSPMIITCMSFGYKYGIPQDADLLFDVRCLPNPYYIPELRELTGRDSAVYDYVLSFDDTKMFLKKLYDMIDFLLPLYIKEGKKQLTVAIGCTGGKHRSVAITETLAAYLKGRELKSVSVHRDIVKKFVGDK